MTTFDDRERAFENLYAHDEELRFRMLVRRNRAVAAWAAAQMGKDADAATAYQAEIVEHGLSHAGDDAIVDRIVSDLAASGHGGSAEAVRAAMARGLAEAVARETSA